MHYRLIISFSILLLLSRGYCAAMVPPRDGNEKPLVRGTQLSGKDSHGDPLPKSAIARLGTIRLRQTEQTILTAFSSDGKYIVSGTNTCNVRLWDAATGKDVEQVSFPGSPQADQRLLFSPDGNHLSYVERVGRLPGELVIKLWDASSKRTLPIRFSIAPIAFSSDSKLVAGTIDRGLVIFDLKTLAIKWRLRRIEHSLQALAFSPDGKLVAASEGKAPPEWHPSTIRLWDTNIGKQAGEWVAHHRPTDSLCFSPDSKALASGGIGGVHLWDVVSHRRLATLEDDGGFVAFSPNGKLLAVSGWSNKLRLWDPTRHKRVRSIHLGAERVRSFAFSPDGKKIVTGGTSHAIRLWEVETGQQILPLSGHEHSVFALQFSPDGKSLTSYGEDLAIRLWDLAAKEELRRFLPGTSGGLTLGPGRIVPTSSLAFSPNEKMIAAIGARKEGEADNPVFLWSVDSGKRICVIQTPKPKGSFLLPTALAFSPDGRALATVNGGGNVQLWSPISAASLRLFPTPRRHPFVSVAFSPDGRTLAASQLDPDQIQLWDWAAGLPIHAFPCQKGGADYITFSPSGHMLASTSCRVGDDLSQSDITIQLHEPASGKLLRTLKGKETSTPCVAFSPNGRLLASAGLQDRAVHIWDTFSGRELATFTGHRGPVYCVAFSPDGKTVASGSADTTILLWDVSKLQPQQPPAIPRNELPKELARLWEEMQAKEASKAYDALWRLIGAGDETVAFLGQKLRPIPPPDAKLLNQAIADLDRNDFDKREAGTAHLTKLGELAEPALKQALQDQPSLEARKRMENLLAELTERSFREVKVSQIRALHALELIGSPTARELLKKLGGGAAGARLTRDAKLALQRLERLTNKP